MKRMLIVTGPQGSGNHMWAKILALHPDVMGWQDLLDTYWIGHDREPFSDCWRDPENLREFDWSLKDYFVTSISVPYMENGEVTMPDIKRFIVVCEELDIDCRLCVLGRDRNILCMQERRVRGQVTSDLALEFYRDLDPVVFLSFELLQMYKEKYLAQVMQQLDFPICLERSKIDSVLAEDSNKKYFHPIKHHWVDDLAKHTSRKWK